MRVICACLFVAVIVGCGKKLADSQPQAESEPRPAPAVGQTPAGTPKPNALTSASEYAPDTSGFSTNDPKTAVRWLAVEFDRIERRDNRDPRYGGMGTDQLHARVHKALVGRQVRWPMTVTLVLKNGAVAVEGALHPQSGYPGSSGAETYCLLVGRPSATILNGLELPAKEPRDWLNAVRPQSVVTAAGTIKSVERSDLSMTQTVAGVPQKWTQRNWSFDLTPGWAEPRPAGP